MHRSSDYFICIQWSSMRTDASQNSLWEAVIRLIEHLPSAQTRKNKFALCILHYIERVAIMFNSPTLKKNWMCAQTSWSMEVETAFEFSKKSHGTTTIFPRYPCPHIPIFPKYTTHVAQKTVISFINWHWNRHLTYINTLMVSLLASRKRFGMSAWSVTQYYVGRNLKEVTINRYNKHFNSIFPLKDECPPISWA